MRKHLLFLLVTFFAAVSLKAANEVYVGYCNGSSTTSGIGNAKGKTWASAAILIPNNIFKSYKGNKLTKVRVALANKMNIDTLQVWVRKELDGNDLSSGYITRKDNPKINTGWNEIALDKQLDVTGEEDYYIGVSYKQRTDSKPLSVVSGSVKNGFFAKWDEEWQDLSASGILSLEAVVFGDNINAYDLSLLSATAKTESENLIVNAQLLNKGSQPISGFTIKAAVTGTDEVLTQHIAQTIASGEQYDANIVFTPKTMGIGYDHQLTLTIDGIDDGEDSNDENNAVSVVYQYPRKVVLEEFTTEQCSNCPRMAGWIHQLLKSSYGNDVVVACHHSGYNSDKFTTQADLDYTWFYNDNGAVYAPAVMFDRCPLFNSVREGNVTPVNGPGSYQNLEAVVKYRLQQPSYAYVNVVNPRIENNEVKVDVTCIQSKTFATIPARLTVYLVEDSILTTDQVGGTTPYYQMHVKRGINNTWGDEIKWNDDNKFEASYSFPLSEDYNKSQLSVIAFVGVYDSEDPNNCLIENGNSAKVENKTSSISKPSLSNDAVIDYYTLDGRYVKEPSHGIYIQKSRFTDGNISIRKIIR